MEPVPEIKLVRTDTTLDLSQKAEKVCFQCAVRINFRRPPSQDSVCGLDYTNRK
jgi:hypothetical protein